MRLDLSIAHYPQTDGQSERTIQTLEDIKGGNSGHDTITGLENDTKLMGLG